jgi:hypothetical protein
MESEQARAASAKNLSNAIVSVMGEKDWEFFGLAPAEGFLDKSFGADVR